MGGDKISAALEELNILKKHRQSVIEAARVLVKVHVGIVEDVSLVLKMYLIRNNALSKIFCRFYWNEVRPFGLRMLYGRDCTAK